MILDPPLAAVMAATWPPERSERLGPWRLRVSAGGGQRVQATGVEDAWQPKSIVYQINMLKAENNELKEQVKVTKTVIVRDTIYIKEKTNFWGKKKVSTDSSSSVDSTIVEQ